MYNFPARSTTSPKSGDRKLYVSPFHPFRWEVAMQATRRAARALVLASALFAVGAGVAASQATGSGPALSSDEQAVYAMVINSWLGQDHGMQRVNLRRMR